MVVMVTVGLIGASLVPSSKVSVLEDLQQFLLQPLIQLVGILFLNILKIMITIIPMRGKVKSRHRTIRKKVEYVQNTN
jgi:hypothetical protein